MMMINEYVVVYVLN